MEKTYKAEDKQEILKVIAQIERECPKIAHEKETLEEIIDYIVPKYKTTHQAFKNLMLSMITETGMEIRRDGHTIY